MGNEQTRGEAVPPSDVADASSVPMPALDELDQMFEQWMVSAFFENVVIDFARQPYETLTEQEEAGTKANARAAMRQMPADKKWFVLQQELLKVDSFIVC
jgi:hypothetical protein